MGAVLKSYTVHLLISIEDFLLIEEQDLQI
jgi:hypothetical protein